MASNLNAAIQAVKDKIETAASGASPEELAYLGTALDRIGGRATVYEVVEIGDQKKAELVAIAEELVASMNAFTDEEQATLQASLNAMITRYQVSADSILYTAETELDNKKAEFDQKLSDNTDAFDATLASHTDSLEAKTVETLGRLNDKQISVELNIATAVSKAQEDLNNAKLSAEDALNTLVSTTAATSDQINKSSLFRSIFYANIF